jgi:uncharacterized membrane protein YphA (DoxX/SURF4 family)|tara:strand:- start:464 stop:805 length:342 start_codon:yes stop_codon:yes gene_type:complete
MNILYKYTHWFLRVPLILTFILHGYPKLGTSVANLGFIGYLVGPFEFFGAILIALGPFFNKEILTKVGSGMIAIIMVGAIYMHLVKWKDGFMDVEWQILLLCVSVYLLIKSDN